MISMKEYAKQNHITYEAVRAQVNRYRDQLDDHIVQDGRTQYLDDVAVAFLDDRRQKNPTVIYQQSKDEAIEALRLEREGLYKKIAEQADQITVLQQFKIETMENRVQLEDAKAAQERRERELNEREGQMAQEISEAAQKAAEGARKAAEEEKKILEGFIQDAKNEIIAVQEEKDKIILEQKKKIQELESRTFGDYLKGLFRRNKE